jgi:3-methyladenine DNA glycosylase AlkD
MRRASAVTLVMPVRRGFFFDYVFEIADLLLLDDDDLVRKGYGWMLKEASRLHRQEVYEYVIKNKAVMPRIALRYAIELMPQDLRRTAMSKS